MSTSKTWVFYFDCILVFIFFTGTLPAELARKTVFTQDHQGHTQASSGPHFTAQLYSWLPGPLLVEQFELIPTQHCLDFLNRILSYDQILLIYFTVVYYL